MKHVIFTLAVACCLYIQSFAKKNVVASPPPSELVSDIKITMDLGYGTGAELKRVLEMMPRWQAASNNGKPIAATWIQPLALDMEQQISVLQGGFADSSMPFRKVDQIATFPEGKIKLGKFLA